MGPNDYQEAVDVLADGIQDDAVQTQVEGLLKPVFELVNNASNFEEVESGLDGLYAEMDESDIADTAEKLTFLGDTWGRLSNGGAQ
jgi:phage gp29-like protein